MKQHTRYRSIYTPQEAEPHSDPAKITMVNNHSKRKMKKKKKTKKNINKRHVNHKLESLCPADFI